MELTFAKTKDDLEEIADLRGKVYTRKSYFELYEERKKYQRDDPWFKPEHSRVIKEGSKIVSHVSIIEKPLRFGPAIVKVAGIGDVYTLPCARGKGYSRILMEDAIQYMRENDYPLTMLYGIPNYYHKFGYIESVKDYQVFLPVAAKHKISSGYSTREWQVRDIPKMLELYKQNSKNVILSVDRNEPYFKRIITESKRILLVLNQQEIVGYAHLFDEFSKQFVVNEAMTANPESSKALAYEIFKRAPESISKIEIKMTPTFPFLFDLQHLGSEIQIKTFAEGAGNGMLAIINLHQLLNELNPLLNLRLKHSEFYHAKKTITLATEKDNLALEIEQGRIKKIDKIHLKERPSIKVEQRYFVRNIVGYWTIDELLNLTSAEVADKKNLRLLNVLFPKEEPFMLPLDYF